MRSAQSSNSPQSAAHDTSMDFLARAKRELDVALPHLNPAIALYAKLKPQVGQMTLLDLQFYATEMEEAACTGATEAETVKHLVAALDALTPEPLRTPPMGF